MSGIIYDKEGRLSLVCRINGPVSLIAKVREGEGVTLLTIIYAHNLAE